MWCVCVSVNVYPTIAQGHTSYILLYVCICLHVYIYMYICLYVYVGIMYMWVYITRVHLVGIGLIGLIGCRLNRLVGLIGCTV
jgi:hypothetical protein